MNDISQLASAMLALVFAAVMLVMGQLYIENRSMKIAVVPITKGHVSTRRVTGGNDSSNRGALLRRST
jgi:hypothetical protein